MLTARVIPCLDIDDGRVVKGVRFQGLRDAGDPVELSISYEAQGADELVMLDVSATPEGRGNALVTVATDLLALTLLIPPGEWGADIVVGNSQRFGDATPIERADDQFGAVATGFVQHTREVGR